MSSAPSVSDVVDAQLESDGKALPVFSAVASKLQRIVSSGDFDMAEVSRLIAGDASISSEILRVANSPLYKGLDTITTVRDAAVRLGAREIASLALMASQRGNFQSRDPRLQKTMRQVWVHGVASALAARWVARRCACEEQAQQAFLAGLLHDVGKLLLLRVMDDMIFAKGSRFEPTPALLTEMLDKMHAEKGTRLMEKWGIPPLYRDVVRDHEAAELDTSNELTAIVRLVDRACHKLGIGTRHQPDLVLAALPEAECLSLSEIDLAELEILLEDAIKVA